MDKVDNSELPVPDLAKGSSHIVDHQYTPESKGTMMHREMVADTLNWPSLTMGIGGLSNRES